MRFTFISGLLALSLAVASCSSDTAEESSVAPSGDTSTSEDTSSLDDTGSSDDTGGLEDTGSSEDTADDTGTSEDAEVIDDTGPDDTGTDDTDTDEPDVVNDDLGTPVDTDVVECPVGSEGCPCSTGGECLGATLECEGGTCVPVTACTTGTEGCECFANNTCLGELLCESGTCVASTCVAGDEGCPCFGNKTCSGDLVCNGQTCEVLVCEEGSEGCPCFGNNTCSGELLCEDDVCTAPSCVTGAVGCECFGNGTCSDGNVCEAGACVPYVCPAGTPGCPCDAGSCSDGYECQAGVCEEVVCNVGYLGCACYPNLTCLPGLECKANVCETYVAPECPVGTDGCPCSESDTCGEGLECAEGLCQTLTCPVGAVGCACFGNGTCFSTDDTPLECVDAVCSPAACPPGTQDCACKTDGSCADGLECSGVGSSAVCLVPVVCPDGTEACPCSPGSLCDTGLYCDSGLCADPGCTFGELGCLCAAGECTGNGVICGSDGWCAQAACPKGTEGCPCTASGGCGINSRLEAMTCIDSLCVAPSCTPGEPGCPCAWGADCTSATDTCIGGFCIPDECSPGQEHCLCSGGSCTGKLTCRDSAVCADNTGYVGGQCNSDGSCTVGTRCDNNTCVQCSLGTTGCGCDDGTCGYGLMCYEEVCVDPATVTLPPDDPVCYTPCTGSQTIGGVLVSCPADGLMEGCYGGLECTSGSCVTPGEAPESCTSDLDCNFFQTCIAGGCYSNCKTNADCASGTQACVDKVCRQNCVADDDSSDCPDDYTCQTVDGVSGSCYLLASASDESQTEVYADYELSSDALNFSNVATTGKITLTNNSPVAEVFTVHKRSDSILYSNATTTTATDLLDDTDCDPLQDCPLTWLHMGEEGATSQVQTFQITVQAGATTIIEFENAAGVDAPRWDGIIEIHHSTFGVQTLTIGYSEVPEGRWQGRVFYFSDFNADENFDNWSATTSSRDDLSLATKVPNALIRRWVAFRTGNISFDEFQAVLLSIRTESWKWASVIADCPDDDGACYPYDNSALGLELFTNSLTGTPIPSGKMELPMAMNLYLPDAEGSPGLMSGRIESEIALQYAGHPGVTLDFGSDPASCERQVAGACMVFVDSMSADVYLGGRYTTDSSDSNCAETESGFELVQTPWLLDGFERATETDSNGYLYRYSCRDTMVPFGPLGGGSDLTDDMITENLSLALSNPVPDGRTRRRRLELVDGALINQTQMFLLFKESFESFLPGSNEDITAYGYILMEREPADLSSDDDNGNSVPDVYEGATPNDERTEPENLLGLSCSQDIVWEASIGTATSVTAANASSIVEALITGRNPAAGAETLIDEDSDEVVHYLCEDTGLFDGGSGAVTGFYTTTVNDDTCGFASAGANFYDGNGDCDDGGPDSDTAICPIGTDKTDCGNRTAADGDFRVECPIGSNVTFFTLDSTWTQEDIAGLGCQDDGTCDELLEEWADGGEVVQFEPVWRCTDESEAFCDSNRLDLRDGKSFYAKYDSGAVMSSLYGEIEKAFRYKIKFQNRDGKSLGFTPEVCDGSVANKVPYCYSPDAIEELRERVECLMAVWEDHYGDLDSDAKALLDETLCINFSYASACTVPTDGSKTYDGFERLYAELLVMMGDESYTQAFASRFDLAGLSPVSFEGTLFEGDDGINLSGTAGYEMYSLYQAAQYYQEALDRFYQLSPHLWGALDYQLSARNFVTPETVTRYFERLIRASTQKARAWSEVAERYKGFNKPDLARRVVERAFTATYVESIILSQLMLSIINELLPEDRPQVAQVLDESARRYRMALLDMMNVHKDIEDNVTFFGYAPDFVPFPAVDGIDQNPVELLIARAKQKTDAARIREDQAIERSKAFDVDAAQFQSELVELTNNYEKQLGDICGTFEYPEGSGKIYPAITKYAELNEHLGRLGNPCGMVQNGAVYDAMVNVDIARTDLKRIRQTYTNVLEEVGIEKSRVEAQCQATVALADYEFETAGEIHTLQEQIKTAELVVSGLDRSMNALSTVAQLTKCAPLTGECPTSFGAIAAYSLGYTLANGAALLAEDAIKDRELEIAEYERDSAKWKTLLECDMAQIDSNARMATTLLRLKEIELEAMRGQYQVRQNVGQVLSQINKAKRLEDELVEAEQLTINIFAARNDPNIRIYRDDAIVNAEVAFDDAIREAYRATKVYEYYTSQSYADMEKLFLIRLVQYGDFNLQNYLIDLENAFYDFEDAYGLPDKRVMLISLRDDILKIPTVDSDGTAYTQTERIQLMRDALKDPGRLDERGYLNLPFSTQLDDLSPLTRNHKIDYLEAEIIGSNIGDTIGRLYVRTQGTGVVRTVTDEKVFHRFPKRNAVINPFFNGNRIFDSAVYRTTHMRERPLVNTSWSLLINQRDEVVNNDIDLQSLTDIRLYIYYNDFTEL